MSPIPVSKLGLAIGELGGHEVLYRGTSDSKGFRQYVLRVNYSYTLKGKHFDSSNTRSFRKASSKSELSKNFKQYYDDLEGQCVVLFNRETPEVSVLFVPESIWLNVVMLISSVIGLTSLVWYECFRRL